MYVTEEKHPNYWKTAIYVISILAIIEIIAQILMIW